MKYYSKYWNREKKLRRHWSNLVLIWILSFITMAVTVEQLKTPEKFISPIATKTFAHEYVTPTLKPHSIEEEIKIVFGEHYKKAMLLLKGNGTKGACAENRALNPKAINDNTAWGGVGKDYGVFQINDKWQGVSNVEFLFDPDINIRLAWNIFKRSGYSFKMWTCGRVYGI